MFSTPQKESDVTGRWMAAALLVVVFGSVAFSATINVRIETDKARYKVGDTVFWTVYAWASSGDNHGVSFLSIHLDDDTDDKLGLPFLDLDVPDGPEFLDTAYGVDEKFLIIASGAPSDDPPDLREISVAQVQWDMLLEVGNDGLSDHVLAKGSYTVSVLGEHTLNPSFYGTGAHYWVDATGKAFPFETQNLIPTSFTVVLISDVNEDYYINFIDYGMILAYWGLPSCPETSDCGNVDLNRDGVLNLADIVIFAGQWLWCTDPGQSYCDQFWQ